MPRGDGTGPFGKGPGTGRNSGSGGKNKINDFNGDKSLGRRPGGYCLCPNCGMKIVHQSGVPCVSVSCPKCSVKMVRE